MNYALHNKELHGTLLKPEAPVIFTKADSALLKDHKPFFVPDHLDALTMRLSLLSGFAGWERTFPSVLPIDITML